MCSIYSWTNKKSISIFPSRFATPLCTDFHTSCFVNKIKCEAKKKKKNSGKQLRYIKNQHTFYWFFSLFGVQKTGSWSSHFMFAFYIFRFFFASLLNLILFYTYFLFNYFSILFLRQQTGVPFCVFFLSWKNLQNLWIRQLNWQMTHNTRKLKKYFFSY